MSVKTYNVLLIKTGGEWLCRASSEGQYSTATPLSTSDYTSAEVAAIETVVKFIGNQQAVPQGTRAIMSSHELGAFILEVDMEFPEPVHTGVPTSEFQTWLDRWGVDEERYEWANEVAIKFLSALGYSEDEQGALGNGIGDEAQTRLIQAILHAPALEFAADIMESISKFGGYIKPEQSAVKALSLSDCYYYESNALGDCGGRVEMVRGTVMCENCRNARKM